jgi:hypothetical protein
MFIAVSNNHGWGKGKTEAEAIKYAVQNSLNRRADLMAVWACEDMAHVDGMGTAYGVLGDRRRFERKGATAGKWKEVPDTDD